MFEKCKFYYLKENVRKNLRNSRKFLFRIYRINSGFPEKVNKLARE